MPHGLKGRAPGPPAAGPPMNFGRHFGRAVCYRYGPLDAGGSYAVARVHSQWGVDPLGVGACDGSVISSARACGTYLVWNVSCGTSCAGRVERRVTFQLFSHNMFSLVTCQHASLAAPSPCAEPRPEAPAPCTTCEHTVGQVTTDQDPAMINVSKKLSKTRITIPLPGALMRALPWGSGQRGGTL